MKKIENITIHRNCNYGSVLQTYATQVTFEELGFECETIDFIRELDTKRGALKRLKKKSKKLASNPILLVGAKAVMLVSYLKKEKTFNAFLNNHVNLSKKVYHSNQELKDNIPNADAYCTGSDQIWNSFWNEGVEPAYYLDFVPDNAFCFSYASSIGQKIEKSEKNIIAKMLQKYKYISVRESQSITSLNELGIKDVVQVLDPTLYRTCNLWKRLASNKFSKRRYVVTYNLHHDKKLDAFASKLAKEKNLELLNISYNWHDMIRPGKLVWCPSVEEYLGLIRDAEYVIADSFHATAFSIQFHKKFISFYPEKASMRIRDVLKKLDIPQRGTEGNPEIENIEADIDYNMVDNLLNKYRKQDEKYLVTVANEEMTSLYQWADIVFLPLSEKSSLNSGSAMLSITFKKTLVATLVGTLMDFPQDSMFTYRYDNEEEHYQAASVAFERAFQTWQSNHSNLRDMGEQLYLYAQKKFSLPEVAKRYGLIYSELEN